MAWTFLILPTREIDRTIQPDMLVVGPRWKTREEAEDAARSELDDVRDHKLPVHAVVLEDRRGRIAEVARIAASGRSTNPSGPSLAAAATVGLGVLAAMTARPRQKRAQTRSTSATARAERPAKAPEREAARPARRQTRRQPEETKMATKKKRSSAATATPPARECAPTQEEARKAIAPAAKELGCSVEAVARAAVRPAKRKPSAKPQTVPANVPGHLGAVQLETTAQIVAGADKVSVAAAEEIAQEVGAVRVAKPTATTVVAVDQRTGEFVADAGRNVEQLIEKAKELVPRGKVLVLEPLVTGDDEADAAYADLLARYAVDFDGVQLTEKQCQQIAERCATVRTSNPRSDRSSSGRPPRGWAGGVLFLDAEKVPGGWVQGSYRPRGRAHNLVRAEYYATGPDGRTQHKTRAAAVASLSRIENPNRAKRERMNKRPRRLPLWELPDHLTRRPLDGPGEWHGEELEESDEDAILALEGYLNVVRRAWELARDGKYAESADLYYDTPDGDGDTVIDHVLEFERRHDNGRKVESPRLKDAIQRLYKPLYNLAENLGGFLEEKGWTYQRVKAASERASGLP